MKRGLLKDIKNDISVCQTCKYKNTNTQIHSGHNSVGPIVSLALVGGDQVAQVAQEALPPQLFTRRWVVPSDQYAVTLPEFLNVMDVTETSM